jgi:hypothetical protein
MMLGGGRRGWTLARPGVTPHTWPAGRQQEMESRPRQDKGEGIHSLTSTVSQPQSDTRIAGGHGDVRWDGGELDHGGTLIRVAGCEE